jgi:p-cumate 2,3-dioxygenase ferredoxin component
MSGSASRLRVCGIDEIAVGAKLQVNAPGLPTLALYRVGAMEFYCTDDICTHGSTSLTEEGELEGPIIECGAHGGKFDVRTGEACAPPCVEPLRTYPVTLEEGWVYVDA